MITNIYIQAATGVMRLRQAFAKTSKSVAEATCPANCFSDLKHCYKNSEFIRSMTLRMTLHPNLDVGFMSDFFEMRPDGFTGYSDLMRFWAEADKAFPKDAMERKYHSFAFQILGAAGGFTKTFDALPSATQAFVNASLSLQKAIIIRHIEAKAVEFIPLLTQSALPPLVK